MLAILRGLEGDLEAQLVAGTRDAPELDPVEAGDDAELVELGVARISWALYLYWDAMARFKEQLASLQT